MTRRRPAGGVALVLAMALAGCGVSSQDEPRPIEGTSTNQPPNTPSVDIEPSPASSSPPPAPPSLAPTSAPRPTVSR